MCVFTCLPSERPSCKPTDETAWQQSKPVLVATNLWKSQLQGSTHLQGEKKVTVSAQLGPPTGAPHLSGQHQPPSNTTRTRSGYARRESREKWMPLNFRLRENFLQCTSRAGLRSLSPADESSKPLGSPVSVLTPLDTPQVPTHKY